MKFSQVIADLGVQLGKDSEAVRMYSQQRTEALAVIVYEPGYSEALKAEGLNVALFAAGRVIDTADAADAALVQTMTTMLAIAVRVLV